MITPTTISTASISDETRLSIARLQARLVEAQKELTTGRHADVGVTLGGNTGTAVALRQEQTQLQSILDSNKIVATRMTASQASLQTISTTAQNFLSSLLGARSSSSSTQTVVQDAKSGLQALIGALNTSLDGQYLFAGINSDVKPFDDYFGTPPPASQQGIATAFLAKFGVAQSDPSVSSISATALGNFLDNEFSAEFADPNWGSAWSEASDKNVRNRISRSELVETSANANQQPFRTLMSALTMVSDLGFGNLNESAQQTLLDKAIALVGNAVTGIANIQGGMGLTQQRVTASNDQIDLQKSLLTTSIDGLESVDPTEVSTRLSALMTQMETAYALTNRIHSLSLLDYLTG